MIKTLCSVHLEALSSAAWISLTYHEEWPQDDDTIRAHAAAWIERVRRRHPTLVYIRRLEWQERSAPHWHYLAWTAPSDRTWCTPAEHRRIRRDWHDIAGYDSRAHRIHGARSVTADSWRQISCYVSKYAAKVDQPDEASYTGRRWSASYALPTRRTGSWELPDRALRRLRRAMILLGRMRGAGWRWQYKGSNPRNEVSIILRPGEADRLVRMALRSAGLPEPPLPRDAAAASPPPPP